MANSHNRNGDGDGHTGRSCLRLGIGAAVAVNIGTTLPAAATPTVVDLAEQRPMDDDETEDYLEDNTEGRIPVVGWTGEAITVSGVSVGC